MKINAIDIRKGTLLEHEGKLWVVLKTMHTQPGKGGAYMQVEMKDIKASTKLNIRFRSSESVMEVNLEHRECQFLYMNGDNLEIMDNQSFEQMSLDKEVLGEDADFLQEGMNLTVKFHNGNIIAVDLPSSMIYEIEECEPVVKGQTATSSYKPAKLSNGVKITVPQFINVGDKVSVKTATREYIERAK